MRAGSRVEGPTAPQIRAERAEQEKLERATRECSMSPQIATLSPSMRPLLRRMVSASSSACVGCSCAPSPALTTEQPTFCARRCDRAGLRMAHDNDVGPHGVQRHRGVEQRFALASEDCATDMFMTSAPSLLPAISKDAWVRVEAS